MTLMDPDSILIILISLLCSAFFSGMEIAFVASNKLHIVDEEKGEFNARLLSSFLKARPDLLLPCSLETI